MFNCCPYLGDKVIFWTWAIVQGCSPEMISRTFKDHNLGGQPVQLPAGKLQGAEIEKGKHGLMQGYNLNVLTYRYDHKTMIFMY
jgi:hypothetical protein